LNALLPDDVAALSCTDAASGFDARRDATSRAYCYRLLVRPARSALLRGRALHWPHALDLDALAECAAALTGSHDFTAFTPTETDHVRFSRDVYSAFWRRADSLVDPASGGAVGGSGGAVGGFGGAEGGSDGAVLEFWIEADAFMRHMNRVLVGTMLEVSSGRRSVGSFRTLLQGRPRSEAGPTTPAHGLYLVGVGYAGERVLRGS
jgi:tRNA pseudouridine38-40 synthase